MFRIIYFSKETAKLPDSGIMELLVQSRSRNLRLEITGMLLYMHGTFLQVIEGPEAAVKRVFESIRADPRHDRLIVLAEEPVTSRDFPNWLMGFEPIDPCSGPHAAEFGNFLKTPWDQLDLNSYSEMAQLFLKTFREISS